MNKKKFVLIVSLLLLMGCENSNQRDKIFLDLNFGINIEEYEELIDTLEKKKVIYSRFFDEKEYYYDFDLFENKPTTVQINGFFYNEYNYLQSLRLDFGLKIESSYLSSSSFVDFINCEEIKRTYSMYVEKYGNPNSFKDRLLPVSLLLNLNREDIHESNIYFWDRKNFKIIFYLGRNDDENKNCYDAAIIYDLNNDAKKKLDEIYYENKRKTELIKKEKAKNNI